MPRRSLRPCVVCGRALVRDDPRCAACRSARSKARHLHTPSAAARGYGHKWRAAREGFLRKHPFCAACLAAGREVRASELDHIRPHGGDRAAFWDRANWQPLCKRCHARKTLGETLEARATRSRT